MLPYKPSPDREGEPPQAVDELDFQYKRGERKCALFVYCFLCA